MYSIKYDCPAENKMRTKSIVRVSAMLLCECYKSLPQKLPTLEISFYANRSTGARATENMPTTQSGQLQYQLYMELKPCLSILGTYRYRQSLEQIDGYLRITSSGLVDSAPSSNTRRR